jgi:hypothetical protein
MLLLLLMMLMLMLILAAGSCLSSHSSRPCPSGLLAGRVEGRLAKSGVHVLIQQTIQGFSQPGPHQADSGTPVAAARGE